MRLRLCSTLIATSVLAACAGTTSTAPSAPAAGAGAPVFSQARLPDPVKVPAGHTVALESVGVGRITYECRVKADAAGRHEWFFAGPDARLLSRGGERLGRYYGPPATWESLDGSRLTATQVAVAPNGALNLPYQLVKANPASGPGAMGGVSYIQRVATRGGVAPTRACAAGNLGEQVVVDYQADYIFYKPA